MITSIVLLNKNIRVIVELNLSKSNMKKNLTNYYKFVLLWKAKASFFYKNILNFYIILYSRIGNKIII